MNSQPVAFGDGLLVGGGRSGGAALREIWIWKVFGRYLHARWVSEFDTHHISLELEIDFCNQ